MPDPSPYSVHSGWGLFFCLSSAVHSRCLTSMRAPLFAIAAGTAIGFTLVGAMHATVARLDQATREQCARQDWPVHQHAAHSEFCRTYTIKAF